MGYDELYTGYLDGKIILNKIKNDKNIETQVIWKDENPIIDIKFDFQDRIWFVQANKEIYYLENRIATKVAKGADGNKKDQFFFN